MRHWRVVGVHGLIEKLRFLRNNNFIILLLLSSELEFEVLVLPQRTSQDVMCFQFSQELIIFWMMDQSSCSVHFEKVFLLILDINSSLEFSSSNFRQFVKFVPKDLQRLMQCFVWKKSKCVIKKIFSNPLLFLSRKSHIDNFLLDIKLNDLWKKPECCM